MKFYKLIKTTYDYNQLLYDVTCKFNINRYIKRFKNGYCMGFPKKVCINAHEYILFEFKNNDELIQFCLNHSSEIIDIYNSDTVCFYASYMIKSSRHNKIQHICKTYGAEYMYSDTVKFKDPKMMFKFLIRNSGVLC